MELRHLRYFEALAETLNFTRAAERMHVTQSTLSHQIRQLEDEAGQLLFNRVGKRISMTDAGEVLLAEITPALRQIDRAIRAVREDEQPLAGEVCVGTTQSFSVQLIPQCLSTFLSLHPSVRVVVEELSADEIAARIAEQSLDLAVSYQPDHADSLFFEPLFSEELRLVVGGAHAMAARKRARMAELHGMRMALLSRRFATRRLLDDCFRAAEAEPQIVAELNSVAPMLELARRTDIATIVGSGAQPPDLGLKFIPLENPTPLRTPGLLWKRGASREKAVSAFAATVRRIVGALNQDL
ncbi:LysR substrate-binding domain-containing protein [Cupriavidus sp. 2SB]|uniref:LysR substrate-binding domain-containing protein n=1 Tax=Cupriavidus sp. 2SB TaxID=2502199 RepID=UPI0010F9EEA3|nr:LysR substrate-binding domain-containing protein [Cupriavidus sp. 2SB]